MFFNSFLLSANRLVNSLSFWKSIHKACKSEKACILLMLCPLRKHTYGSVTPLFKCILIKISFVFLQCLSRRQRKQLGVWWSFFTFSFVSKRCLLISFVFLRSKHSDDRAILTLFSWVYLLCERLVLHEECSHTFSPAKRWKTRNISQVFVSNTSSPRFKRRYTRYGFFFLVFRRF